MNSQNSLSSSSLYVDYNDNDDDDMHDLGDDDERERDSLVVSVISNARSLPSSSTRTRRLQVVSCRDKSPPITQEVDKRETASRKSGSQSVYRYFCSCGGARKTFSNTLLLLVLAYLTGVLTTLVVLNKKRVHGDACPAVTSTQLPENMQLQQQQQPKTADEQPVPTTTGDDKDDTSTSSSSSSTILYLNHSFAFSLLQYHPNDAWQVPFPTRNTKHCRAMQEHDGDDNDDIFYFSKDYFLLQQGLDAQKNQAYCSLATAAAMLNSLRHAAATTTTTTSNSSTGSSFALPVDQEYAPYPYATQENLLNECTQRNVIARYEDTEFDGILAAPYGLGLQQTKALMECHLLLSMRNHDDHVGHGNNGDDSPRRKRRRRNRGDDNGQEQQQEEWIVSAHHVDPTSTALEQVRQDLIEALICPLSRVAVNFDRSVLGQEGYGHWSPVASYAPVRDAFLILDVAKYKAPSFWVSARQLYDSMATRDDCGYWNYPMAQTEMLENEQENLLYPHSSRNWHKAMQQLQCQTSFRGYLIIKPKDTRVLSHYHHQEQDDPGAKQKLSADNIPNGHY